MANNDREPQPYSYMPPSMGESASIASAATTMASQDAIRAALLARARMIANSNGNNSAAAAADTKSSTKNSSTAAAATPAVEDAVQDGGDAIDCFASYVPTALPQCIVSVLKEKAAASMNNDISSTNNGGATGDCSMTTASSSNSNVDNDVIDLFAEKDTSKKSLLNKTTNGNSDEIIEILDRDNEDSRIDTGEDYFKPKNFSTNAAANSDNTDASHDMHNEEKPASKSNHDNSDTTTTTTTSSPIHNIFTTNQISSHTSPAVESALLSSVSAPPVPDSAATTILPLVKDGKLSPLQAEGVCLAINRFNRVFTKKGQGKNDGFMRAGFFIGDGAGIGKGRQISATLLDAFCRNHGRGRHLWISVSRELVQDAKRDLADVGCHVNVHDGAEVLDQMQGGKKGKGLGAGGSLGKGVLFVTYNLLVSGRRMEDIIGWLAGGTDSNSSTGKRKVSADASSKAIQKIQERTRLEHSYSGVIVFDEAHKAKNLEADTRTAKLVLALQERLPNARVLYCSATGVSDIKHMVYAERLGLWGSANPLYPTFDSFQAALAKRGVGAMEMLALEMKRKGLFLARTLSWDGAEFHTLEVKLSKKQISQYDGAVRWWFNLKDQISSALDLMNVDAPKMLWRAFWSAQQRFFREMCICSKVDEISRQALEFLEKDHSIVIGLQSTGEAGMEVALEELAESLAESSGKKVRRSDSGKIDFEDMTLSGLVSTSASALTNLVGKHFPVALPPPEIPKVPAIPPNGFASEADRLEHMRLSDLADRIRNEPPPKPIPELVARRNKILDSIRDLDLPANPLDDLIDRLGGVDNVAEMTGRSGRILRDKSGKYKYVKRFGGPSKQKSFGLSMPVSKEDENDRLNIVEKRKFMQGHKSVAIISDAASTGISLHADRRCNSSHKRRVHFTIELPWAADKAIQQLGRSHRSGQESAPIYKMVVTELGGERRFASAVSKRMAQLGALTKGDRRAATGSDLSEFDIDSVFGRRALARTYTALSEQPISAPSRKSNEILDNFVETEDVATDLTDKDDDEEKRAYALAEAAKALLEVGLTGDPNVKHFLNRIAGLDVARQNLVFSLFMSTLDDVITDAKATGEFEGSVEDIRATTVKLKGNPEIIATDSSSGAKTELTKLALDRGVSFDSMVQTIIDGDKVEADRSKEQMDKNEEADEIEDQCKSGFYISRRKIAGRYLVMFAQRKVEKEDVIDRDFIDPLNLMIITRPNTGKNPCEMSSQDVRYKYRLLASSSEILAHLRSTKEDAPEDEEKKSESDESEPQDAVSIIRRKFGSSVADLWDDAYDNSNYKDHHDGLAPRISELGLITGAVLHILPSLEKAVQFMPTGQRSLRVMRVELSESGQRIVGIKFPVSKEALERLTVGMKEVAQARQGSLDSPSYIDEPFSPIDDKAKSWATAERKTMKSFFGAAASKSSGASNSKNDSASSSSGITKSSGKRNATSFVSPHPLKSSDKKQKTNASKAPAKKTPKTASISSFFGKKSNY